MVNNKMCIGVEQERLMIRIGPEVYDEVMEKPGVAPMDFTGKVMKGYVFVDAGVLNTSKRLGYWVGLALKYNKTAKASKSRPSKKAVKPAGIAAKKKVKRTK